MVPWMKNKLTEWVEAGECFVMTTAHVCVGVILFQTTPVTAVRPIFENLAVNAGLPLAVVNTSGRVCALSKLALN